MGWGSRRAEQRVPCRIGGGVGIAVFIGPANRRHWTPAAVSVLAGESRLQSVMVRHKNQSEKTGVLDRRITTGDSGRASDAGQQAVAYRRIGPKPGRQGLIGGARRTRCRAEFLDFVQTNCVFGA